MKLPQAGHGRAQVTAWQATAGQATAGQTHACSRSYALAVGDEVANEALLLAARELVVLVLVVGFFAWVAYRLVRESHR